MTIGIEYGAEGNEHRATGRLKFVAFLGFIGSGQKN